MRVCLSADMEGVSQISDPREVKAFFREYWETGRNRYNEDVVAAVSGLLAGGATEVVVLDNHASGNRVNLNADALPQRGRLESWNVFDLKEHGVDAMLQVGYHARCGGIGFISHTYVGGVHLRADGELLSESHGRAWASAVPLLGIIGNDTHERVLGSLSGTPYLVVQRTIGRGSAAPIYPRPSDSAEAIRHFATDVMRNVAGALIPDPPEHFLFEASIPETVLNAASMHDASWQQVSDTGFQRELRTWEEARPLVAAAMASTVAPWQRTFGTTDLQSEEALLTNDPASVQVARESYLRWIDETQTDWIDH
jgi:D-amino peptidase